MDDITLEAMTIEDRNRVLDAWLDEITTDLETAAELHQEYARLGVRT